jgi:hypothetical protein
MLTLVQNKASLSMTESGNYTVWKISEIDIHENMVVLSNSNNPVLRRFSAPSKIVSAQINGLDLIVQTVDGYEWTIQIPTGSRKRLAPHTPIKQKFRFI